MGIYCQEQLQQFNKLQILKEKEAVEIHDHLCSEEIKTYGNDKVKFYQIYK